MSLGEMDFTAWTQVFGDTLSRIGRALVVMIPALRPFAITRSWCVFEWYVIATRNIKYINVVYPKDEEEFIAKLFEKRLLASDFNAIFDQIYVTKATAFKASDQNAIQSLLRQVGPPKVNGIVTHALQKLLVDMLDKAFLHASTPKDKFSALFSKLELYAALNLDELHTTAFTVAKDFFNHEQASLDKDEITLLMTHDPSGLKLEDKSRPSMVSRFFHAIKSKFGKPQQPNKIQQTERITSTMVKKDDFSMDGITNVKFLLLGIARSGKSTILQQLRVSFP